MGLLGPMIIGRTVDRYIRTRDFRGVLISAAMLLLAYLIGLVATYVQTQQMGRVGRYVLFNLRNTLFTKLQELPLEFFNQNKAGDLISRINNDTDKLNQFFSQALVQLAANVFVMIGAAIFLVTLNARLGLAALAPAAAVLAITRITRRLGEAPEPGQPAVARRAQRRGPGEHEQLPRDPRVQPRGLLRAPVRRGQRAQLRRRRSPPASPTPCSFRSTASRSTSRRSSSSPTAST